MQAHSFVVSVVQNTLAVFARGLENPFNGWSDEAYAQGFSWRDGSVSFQIPEDGDLPVIVSMEKQIVLRPDSLRAILVPFSLTRNSGVEISGIYERTDRVVSISPGLYSLYFEYGISAGKAEPTDEEKGWCVVTFIAGALPAPAILKKDAQLHPSDPPVLEGKPA